MLGTLIILAYLLGDVAIFIGVSIVIYKLFLSDWVKNRKIEKKRIGTTPEIEKLAKLQLISNNSIAVESFVRCNASVLSDDMINQLIDHIEELRLQQKFVELETLEDSPQRIVQRKSE